MIVDPVPPNMGVLSHGIDVVEERRIAEMVERHGTRLLDRVFTAGEQEYCRSSGALRPERLAARFAAKEAVLKALGTGWRGGIAWTDVEVERDAAGRPGVRLEGEAAAVATRLGVRAWHLSLTHAGGVAIASVIACGAPPTEPSHRNPGRNPRSDPPTGVA